MFKLYGLASLLVLVMLAGCDGDREQDVEDGGSTCANGQCHRAPQYVPQSVAEPIPAEEKPAATATDSKQPEAKSVDPVTPAASRVIYDAAGNQYLVLKKGETPPLNVWYVYEEDVDEKSAPTRSSQPHEDRSPPPVPASSPRAVHVLEQRYETVPTRH